MSFAGADIGNNHDLVVINFQIRLKKAKMPNQPDEACTFQATLGGKFAPPYWAKRRGHGHQNHDNHLQYSSD